MTLATDLELLALQVEGALDPAAASPASTGSRSPVRPARTRCGSDGLGALGEALDELILRARARVVQEAIGQLRAALVPVDGQGRSGDWYIGRFRCFPDVATFVEERIAQVHGYWRPYRHDQPRLAGMTEADRELVYNAMLRTGQSALRLLDQEADLVCFLEAGARATDLPAIQQACRAIASMLGFRIEVEPGCSFRRPRAAPLSGAAEGQ